MYLQIKDFPDYTPPHMPTKINFYSSILIEPSYKSEIDCSKDRFCKIGEFIDICVY